MASELIVSHAHLRRLARRRRRPDRRRCSAGCIACAIWAACSSSICAIATASRRSWSATRQRRGRRRRPRAARIRRRRATARSKRGRAESVNPKHRRPARSKSSPPRLEILNEAKTPPFPINDDAPVAEETRLRYRYLDLRRPALQRTSCCGTRSRSPRASTSTRRSFLEIETPILTRSTPEGARDYLVPSRVHPGEFFALPQSPQIFKQILMIAGLDRYFQIVPLLPRRGPARRSPAGVHADRRRDVVRRPRSSSTASSKARSRRCSAPPAIDGRDAVPAHQLRRGDAASTDRTSPTCGRAWRSRTSAPRSPSRRSAFPRRGRRRRRGARLRRAGRRDSYSRKRARRADASRSQQLGASGLVVGALGAGRAAEFGAQGCSARRSLRAAFDAAGGAEGDLLLFMAGGPAHRWRDALGQLRLHVAKQREPAAGRRLPVRAGSPSSRSSSGTRTRSAGTRCTIRSRRRGRRTCRCSSRRRSECARAPYDLALNGSEIAGGSIRIHRADVQRQVFRLLGISDEDAKARFGFFLDALEYGTPPHGGIAFGLDRIVALHLRRVVDSRRHRVPEDGAGRRPHGRRAVDGRRQAAARASHRHSTQALTLTRMRLGIDLGGTKIAAVVLATDGRRVWEHARRRRRATTTTRTIDAIAGLVAAGEAAARRDVHGRHRHSRRDFAGDRPRQERQLDLAQRPAAASTISSARLGREVRLANDANCLAVSEADRRRRRRRARRVRRDSRHRHGRRHRRRRSRRHGRERDRRRVGAQPAAVAGRRRAAGAGVLLRPARLSSRRFCPGPGLAADYRAARRRGDRAASEVVAARRARASRWRPTRSTPGSDRLARALATVINLLDPDVDRRRRRPVADRAHLRRTCRALWARVGVLGSRRHAARAGAAFGDASGVRGAAWLWDARVATDRSIDVSVLLST